jgi:hypothetical protein
MPLPDGGDAPVGLKVWLVDGEEFPLLELRELVIEPATGAAASPA